MEDGGNTSETSDNLPSSQHPLLEDEEGDEVNSSCEWSMLSSDLLSNFWLADADACNLHPSTWPEEVALPRFPPDPSPAASRSPPADDIIELGHRHDDDVDDVDDDAQPYQFYHSSCRQQKFHRREANKRNKGKITVSPRRQCGEFGSEKRLIFRNRDFQKLQVTDPEAIILWPEWMLTETGFQGFRIVGKGPVFIHAANRQFVIDIADGDKANSFVLNPNAFKKNEGANLITVTDSSGDKEQPHQKGKLQDFNIKLVPWTQAHVV